MDFCLSMGGGLFCGYVSPYLLPVLSTRPSYLSSRLGLRRGLLHRPEDTYVVKQKDDHTCVGGVSSCSCRCGGSSSPFLRFRTDIRSNSVDRARFYGVQRGQR